jgi:hypothetical protein
MQKRFLWLCRKPSRHPLECRPFVVVASLHRPLGGCIAEQRYCRATVATVATMQRSWDRQGQTPTCSAIVATVAPLHRCMQRCNDRSLHPTMQRSGGQTATTWPGSKTHPARPRTGFSTKPAGLPAAEVLPTARGTAAAGHASRRAAPEPAAPQPPAVRQGYQRLDLEPGGPGLPHQGLDPAPPQRRSGPPGPETAGHPLEAVQHWITSPDPAYARKKARDRLIRLAQSHPDWVLGYLDETW